MNRLTAAAILAASLFAARPALSCSPAPGWPDKARVATDLAAERMVQQATYIDIAVVERLTADFDVGTRRWAAMRAAPEGSPLREVADGWLNETREAWAEDGARIHFRVLQRLKGNSPPEFTLNGSKPLLPESARPRALRAVALNQLQYFLDSADLVDGPGMGDCTVAVIGDVGRMYLIFRDAEGLPLRTDVPVRFGRDVAAKVGPSVVPVLSVKDPWPTVVIGTLARGP